MAITREFVRELIDMQITHTTLMVEKVKALTNEEKEEVIRIMNSEEREYYLKSVNLIRNNTSVDESLLSYDKFSVGDQVEVSFGGRLVNGNIESIYRVDYKDGTESIYGYTVREHNVDFSAHFKSNTPKKL